MTSISLREIRASNGSLSNFLAGFQYDIYIYYTVHYVRGTVMNNFFNSIVF